MVNAQDGDDLIEMYLRNRFPMDQARNAFIDHFSAAAIAVGSDVLELRELCTRGISAWRNPVTETLLRLRAGVDGSSMQPIHLQQVDCYPWAVYQSGLVPCAGDACIRADGVLFSPSFNRYVWQVTFTNPGATTVELELAGAGQIQRLELPHMMCAEPRGVACIFKHGVLDNPRAVDCVHDNKAPAWQVCSASVAVSSVDPVTKSYAFAFTPFRLNSGESRGLTIEINYEIVDHAQESFACGLPAYNGSVERDVAARHRWWLEQVKAGMRGSGSVDPVLKAKALAGLLRCGSYWPPSGVVTSCCTITDWPGMVFFWDSIIASLGLGRMHGKLGLDAIRGIYVRQRGDGCTSASKYMYRDGSTVYPMATIASWALVQHLRDGVALEAMADLIASTDRLHAWYVETQDHDRDGLCEWRYSGCSADDTPLFDRYAPHSSRGTIAANFCLPPIASVSLNSYLVLDSKCLAQLHERLGDFAKAAHYREQAAERSRRLVGICLDREARIFNDFDHHLGQFNRALTLWSFLPLWAGVPVEEALRRHMIEDVLLSPEHFFGEYPFPYLAYSDPAYRPSGYWRGRIWLHTAVWMLELLWHHGYEKEADQGADRLLKMISRYDDFLENYNSSALEPGGGQPAYNWAFASYLQIADRMYREPVLTMLDRSGR